MAYRYLTSVLLFSLTVVAPLSGCGDAQPTNGGDTGESTESGQGDLATVPNIGPDATAGVPVTPGAPDTSFAGQVASGVCAWLRGCCTTLEQEDFVASVTAGDTQTDTYALTLELRNDPAVCRELIKGHVLELWRDADSAVATGRAAYNDAATAACLASFSETSCTGSGFGDIARPEHPCYAERLVEGLVSTGSLCTQDFECTPGSYCEVPLGSDFGACRTYAAAGAPCSDDEACGPSAYCGGAGEFGVCADTSADLSPYCNLHVDCGPGEYCATATHTCVPALADGAVCQANPYCASSFCALQTSQTCEATRGINELCTSDASCGQAGYCDDTPPDVQRCLALTQLAEGERCDLGAAVCGEGLLCEDGLCVPRSSMGGPCVSADYCPSNAWCEDGSCVARAPIGGVCEDDSQCVAIGWCNGGECEARIEIGLSCDANSRCADGAHCAMPDGVIGTCQPLPSAGSDCADGKCAAGLGCVTYTGVCAAHLASGANCERSEMCAPEQRCASAGLSSNVCQPPKTVSIGESCLGVSVSCAPNLYCSGGVCAAFSVSGEACSADDQCVAGTSCVLGTCKTYGGAFANCDSHEDCANGLYCDTGVQQCAPQKTLDQACSEDSQCQGSLYCDTTTLACAFKKNASESCNKAGECQDGLYCNITGTCSARLGAGQTCNETPACLDGLACVGGVCVGPAAPGMVCDPVMGCMEEAACNPQTNLCEALGSQGTPCDVDANCTSDLFCGALAPSCVDRGESGDACDTMDGCVPGLSCRVSGLCRARSQVGEGCVPGTPQCVADALCDPSGICQALTADRGIGEPCGDHAQCETQLCEAGICVGSCLGTF